VSRYLQPDSLDELIQHVRHAFRTSTPLSAHGGRHAMGGHQFLTQGSTIDLTKLRRVTGYDTAQGHVAAEAGIMWSDLIAEARRFCTSSPACVHERKTGRRPPRRRPVDQPS
jgi:FAD/FMN-containing dehydrogenase